MFLATQIPLLLAWAGMLLALALGHPGRHRAVAAGAALGYLGGVAGEQLLLGRFPGEFSYRLLKGVTGGSFLLFWGIAVAALYCAGSKGAPPSAEAGAGAVRAGVSAAIAGVLAGALSLCSLAPQQGGAVAAAPLALLALSGALLPLAMTSLARALPARLVAGGRGVAAVVVSGWLFLSCSLPRLDLFSPLSMKVMKFIHDFVHQFFETMLIPDHLFFRAPIWEYIGLLFGDRVGLWGGLLIWFVPVLLIALAIRLERLPSVAHIRQGAKRRKLLASFIRDRRLKLAAPLLALVLLSAGVYRSRFPAIEYWDPKPLPVTAGASGEILIPLKGEVDLSDGKMHKYLFKRGGQEVRFFIITAASGRLTVVLDACAICKPDGYGQSGDMVICYYCVTLIPLDTVGQPGGCNPVPVPFQAKEGALSIDGGALLNSWANTVQETTRVKAAK